MLIPRHVAVIMDGNGRWAVSRGLPRVQGHRRGVEAVRRLLDSCEKYGVQYLTIFAFSSENWSRPAEEIGELMGLLRFYIKSELANLHKKGIRLKIIGDRKRLEPDVLEIITHAEKITAANRGAQLNIALSYGGRMDIVAAAKAAAQDVLAGKLDVAAINEEIFANYLETADIPDPDLLIRTSGEQRISNFMLWQLAYTELVFIERLWPDFNEQDFLAALKQFSGRQRRFGGITAQDSVVGVKNLMTN